MDFSLSPTAQAMLSRLQAFVQSDVLPRESEYFAALQGGPDYRRWRQPPVMEQLKAKARSAGLWNLFLPDAKHGPGLSTLEYAPLAEAMGWSFLLPEVFNCNAPDSGNMEVLHRYGSTEQKERWLAPLLAGEIRSGFAMTEPAVASSDATNIAATATMAGSEVICSGRKWWCSGLGHPNCRVLIFMGVSVPDAPKHQRHSMVLVPLDTPGVKIERMLPVFGGYDEPFGHGEVTFDEVRVPVANIIAGPGRGFEIAQGRLGPGRIHHCMRAIGAAERALKLLCDRASSRVAFGKPLVELGGNLDVIADARMQIDQARLLVLKTAWLIDRVGAKGAMSEISQIKVLAPQVACRVIDAAIQVHGGAGVSEDVPLTALYAYARVLRIADGPDEVHRALVGKLELRRQQQRLEVKS